MFKSPQARVESKIPGDRHRDLGHRRVSRIDENVSRFRHHGGRDGQTQCRHALNKGIAECGRSGGTGEPGPAGRQIHRVGHLVQGGIIGKRDFDNDEIGRNKAAGMYQLLHCRNFRREARIDRRHAFAPGRMRAWRSATRASGGRAVGDGSHTLPPRRSFLAGAAFGGRPPKTAVGPSSENEPLADTVVSVECAPCVASSS